MNTPPPNLAFNLDDPPPGYAPSLAVQVRGRHVVVFESGEPILEYDAPKERRGPDADLVDLLDQLCKMRPAQ